MRVLMIAMLLLGTPPADPVRFGFWRGFERTVEPRVVRTRATTCATIGVQNLDSAEARVVLKAASEVCTIFHSDAFASAFRGRSLLASCEIRREGSDTISGESALALLRGARPTFSVIIRRPPSAVGLTWRTTGDAAATRVALYPEYYRRAEDADRHRSVHFRANLAHEWSHAASGRIRDHGNGPACSRDRLVSYVVHETVEALWIGPGIRASRR